MRNRKTLAMVVALVLVFGCAVGGTLAWLLDKTDTITNTFTDSDINITLTEDAQKDNNYEFKMIPGWDITKDPVVTLMAGSEACYLFVEVTEELGAWKNNMLGNPEREPKFTEYLGYSVVSLGDKAWSRGQGSGEGKNGVPTNVYFIRVPQMTTEDTTFPILEGNKVTVSDLVTKEMMDGIDGVVPEDLSVTSQEELEGRPTLTFQAFAVQLYKTNSDNNPGTDTDEFKVSEAWEIAEAMKPSVSTN